jgi:nickel-dependent lactate racemase
MKNSNEQCLKSADNIQIKYGKKSIELNLNKSVDILSKEISLKPLTINQIFEKLENNSIYSESITQMIKKSKNILIILPDITRKSGAELILPKLIEIIEKSNKNFSFIFATGTHRQMTEDEKKHILSKEIFEKYSKKILPHDPDDIENHNFYGKTKRNTPILINKAYKAHDLIIPIASVSYHYFAGFGGGRKMIVPGIAARKTAIFNHKLVLDEYHKCKHSQAVTGNLKFNPVHDDIVEMVMIARAHCNYYAVNTILNDNSEIIDVIGGDLFMSHIKATEILKEITSICLDKKYDSTIVSTGGFPKDINMVQAQKSLDRATLATKEGGDIIFFAECIDGYGNNYFKDFFELKSAQEMFNSLMNDYQINRQTAYNLKNNLEKFNVYLYSNFDDSDVKRMGFIPLANLENVHNLIENGNTAFIPNAYNAFFEINKS